jgi:cytochrome c553
MISYRRIYLGREAQMRASPRNADVIIYFHEGKNMKRSLACVLFLVLPAMALGAEGIIMPDWAYPPRDEGGGGRGRGERDESLQTVPGSDKQYTQQQVSQFFGGIEDWFPDEHGPMPDIVKFGRRPDARACAACHLTNGAGHPSGGMLSGMSVEYFTQQIKDFANGLRTAVDPARTEGMVGIATALTDDEIREAAEYYASIEPIQWVEVREVEMSPVTFIGTGNMRFVRPDAGTEPIGSRIVEVAADQRLTELRDPHSGFIAYVPVGSVARGEALVSTGGNGKTLPCGACHGPDLRGIGAVPGIAGRLPTYVTRQMLDIQQGTRNGAGAALMKPVVEDLTLDDLVDIAAYTASLPPS